MWRNPFARMQCHWGLNVLILLLSASLSTSTDPEPCQDINEEASGVSCRFSWSMCGWESSDSKWELSRVSAYPFITTSCNFEGNCGYRFGSIWKRHSGYTDTYYTGPSGDHTPNLDGNGHYAYLEASDNRGKTGRLQTPTLPTSPVDVCLQFYYHMYGYDMGTLRVKIFYPQSKTWLVDALWESSGNQGYYWKQAQVTLRAHLLTTDFQIVFEGEILLHGHYRKSDMAVDDIKTTPTSCPVNENEAYISALWLAQQRMPTFSSAKLNTALLCKTDNRYLLTIRYLMLCKTGKCMFSVSLFSGVNKEHHPVWNTTAVSPYYVTQEMTIQSPDNDFWISIDASRQEEEGTVVVIVDFIMLRFGEISTRTTSRPFTSPSVDSSVSPAVETTEPTRQFTTLHLNSDTVDTKRSGRNTAAIGIGVSVAMLLIVVVSVIVVVVIRRRKSDSNSGESPWIPECLKRKKTPANKAPSMAPGVVNFTYSSETNPEPVHLATNGMDNTYAKVNKPKKGGDVYSVPNKGPKAAASRGAANSDVYHELEGDGAETDHYSVPDDADSSKRKGDNGYELAAAKLSMAPNTTPRNIGLNKAKGTAGSKPSRGPNPGAEREDEYNKLAIQTPRMASPAIPDTDDTYNHLDKRKHGVPTDQTGGNEYSLAKPDEAVSSKSTGNPRRQDYVNVNPNTSPREDEYHSLDFDSGHAPNSAVTSTGTTGGRDEYNHLQSDGPGFKVQGEDDQYNALDFDSHGQVQKGDDGMVYSHLNEDQSAV